MNTKWYNAESKKRLYFCAEKSLKFCIFGKDITDYKKMLGLVICYFNNNQLFFQVFSLSKLMFFTEE